jgi:hypothetical protein
MKTACEWLEWAKAETTKELPAEESPEAVEIACLLATKCEELEKQNSALLEVIDNLAQRIVIHTKELKELKSKHKGE